MYQKDGYYNPLVVTKLVNNYRWVVIVFCIDVLFGYHLTLWRPRFSRRNYRKLFQRAPWTSDCLLRSHFGFTLHVVSILNISLDWLPVIVVKGLIMDRSFCSSTFHNTLRNQWYVIRNALFRFCFRLLWVCLFTRMLYDWSIYWGWNEYRKSSIKRRGAYSKLDFFDAALIRGRRLFKQNQRFQTNILFSVKELIFLLPHQNQVADLACSHFQYQIHSPGIDQLLRSFEDQ